MGFPLAFFKPFRHVLVPLLLSTFQELIENLIQRATLHTATTVFLPKPGNDATLPKSYRQISLLNLENKMFAKILPTKLVKLIPRLIDTDKAGIVPGRLAANHAHLFCNILHSVPDKSSPCAVVSIDAENAFDRVEWGFPRIHPGKD